MTRLISTVILLLAATSSASAKQRQGSLRRRQLDTDTDFGDFPSEAVSEDNAIVEDPMHRALSNATDTETEVRTFATAAPSDVVEAAVPAIATAVPSEEVRIVELTEAPIEATEAPVEATEVPVEASLSPDTESPVEASEAPASDAPVEASMAPDTDAPASDAPVEASEAPTTEAPVEATEAPTEAMDTRVIVDEITIAPGDATLGELANRDNELPTDANAPLVDAEAPPAVVTDGTGVTYTVDSSLKITFFHAKNVPTGGALDILEDVLMEDAKLFFDGILEKSAVADDYVAFDITSVVAEQDGLTLKLSFTALVDMSADYELTGRNVAMGMTDGVDFKDYIGQINADGIYVSMVDFEFLGHGVRRQ